ncbi:hypothetical protein GOP47_0022095 [Adiantum capillus-veneris]|uniref:30S ribosomal protein 3, chloroplastic n=1 Tax=Adiantum capillus-veneris TaxID=13818 RepID=A0A9D4Z5U6_ADICA|nr:hypothetical protein GOP47_0022095 [Adiantum capillus-veneris]
MPSSSATLSSASALRGSSFGCSHCSQSTNHRRGRIVSADAATISSSKKGKVTAKKPKVMLRFVWMEKNIGIGLDQVVPGHGTVPLSSYYFWPRKDAWEEIKTKLESKKWISRKQTILLLNQATDVINLWQQNATG